MQSLSNNVNLSFSPAKWIFQISRNREWDAFSDASWVHLRINKARLRNIRDLMRHERPVLNLRFDIEIDILPDACNALIYKCQARRFGCHYSIERNVSDQCQAEALLDWLLVVCAFWHWLTVLHENPSGSHYVMAYVTSTQKPLKSYLSLAVPVGVSWKTRNS